VETDDNDAFRTTVALAMLKAQALADGSEEMDNDRLGELMFMLMASPTQATANGSIGALIVIVDDMCRTFGADRVLQVLKNTAAAGADGRFDDGDG
jgi:hypothetical protein